MTLTLRWWERDEVNATSVNKLPLTTKVLGALQPTLNASATLLRSRFYPQLAMEETDVASHSDIDWAKFTVMFVAWYDENGTGSVPQPNDLDARIVATARLIPRRVPSVITPTNGFYVTWDSGGAATESFGQRKPNPLTLVNPQLNYGMWVLDASAFYYTGHTNVGFTFTCYAEALFGV